MPSELFTIGIPFFFILAIIYGALELGGVFKNKGVKFIIAISIAAISMTNQLVIDSINLYLPFAGAFFVVVFFIGFIHRAFIQKENKDYVLILVVLGLVLIIFARQGELFRGFFDGLPFSYENFIIAIAVILMAIMFHAAYKRGEK